MRQIMLLVLAVGCADVEDATSEADGEVSAPCGRFTVQGQIEGKYYALGGVNALGCPTTNETATPPPRAEGRFNHFDRGGSIYWSPRTGAHEIHGLIRAKWSAKGYERGPLGFPTTDEGQAWHGRFNHFEGGSIYWNQGWAQAYEVHGLIAVKYGATGWERGLLGFPTSDETPTPNRPGAFNRFENGSLYWRAGTGEAFIVRLDMRDQCWSRWGWENGTLGFPIEDTHEIAEFSQSQRFEHGSLLLDGTTGLCFIGP